MMSKPGAHIFTVSCDILPETCSPCGLNSGGGEAERWAGDSVQNSDLQRHPMGHFWYATQSPQKPCGFLGLPHKTRVASWPLSRAQGHAALREARCLFSVGALWHPCRTQRPGRRHYLLFASLSSHRADKLLPASAMPAEEKAFQSRYRKSPSFLSIHMGVDASVLPPGTECHHLMLEVRRLCHRSATAGTFDAGTGWVMSHRCSLQSLLLMRP